MNDFTVKDLLAILKPLPEDSRVNQHSGEQGGILYIISKNGNKQWSVLKDGTVKKMYQ